MEGEGPVVAAAVEGEGPVVAAAEAAVPVEIWTLRTGQAYAAKLVGPTTIKVRAVYPVHAAALHAVLAEKVKAEEWVVADLEHVGVISYVDRLLTLGIEALLPAVAENKRSAAYLRALWIWSRDMEDAAAEIPGDFFYKVRGMGIRVRKLVAAAMNGNPAEQWLEQKIGELVASATSMKNSLVFPMDREGSYMIMMEQEGNYVLEDEENVVGGGGGGHTGDLLSCRWAGVVC
ncbi:unnamed protein product [Urochloa humidicola]